MYTWTRFPFVRLSFAGIVGILLFELYPEWWSSAVLVFFLLVGIYCILGAGLFLTRFSKLSFLFGVTALVLTSFSIGWIAKANESIEDPLHWRNATDRIIAFEGVVVSDVLEKARTNRYSIRVMRVTSKKETHVRNGQLHLYVKKDSAGALMKYGDVVRVLATPSKIPPPSNPEEFNYSAYVARQQIHGQCFVNPNRLEIIGHEPEWLILDKAFEFRRILRNRIERYMPDEETQAIALALLVGVKDHLSDDLKTAYASAGAMHVLAVSGLHVGILYIILLGVLKPLEKLKGGNVLIAVVAIVVIWGYTFVTGMSPSVLRAATMFSVFATSKAVDRESNIYNSLGIAAFILMAYNPNLIFEVGFQLSFLAVTGIVYLQPKIYHLLYVHNRFLEKVWMITAVSIAAQISTLPLTIYYFHQFPTYFFLSNLVVIPGAMIIMVGGIGMLAMGSIIDSIGVALGWILNGIIWCMNWLVQLVEQIPGSLITWLYFDGVQMLLVYGVMVLLLLGLYHKSSFYLNFSMVCWGLFFLWGHVEKVKQLETKELVIYDVAGTVAVDQIAGGSAELYVGNVNEVNHELLRFQIDPYRRANGFEPFETGLKSFKSLESTNGALKYAELMGTKILVLDSFNINLNIQEPLRADLLVVNNQSVKSVKWLLESFEFDLLIIGSDNSYYYSGWLQSEMGKERIQTHSLLLDGSWRSGTIKNRRSF